MNLIRGKGKHNTDYGLKDFFKLYREISKSPVVYSKYSKVINDFNKEISRMIVEDSYEFRFPYRIGYLRIRKFKTKLKLDDDGNLKIKHLRPDWKATNELWNNNEEAKLNKKIVYHTNKHSNGYYFKWFLDKSTTNVKNMYVYMFYPCRNNQRFLSKTIQTEENVDYYE